MRSRDLDCVGHRPGQRDQRLEGEEKGWVLGRRVAGTLVLKQAECRRECGLSDQGNCECRDRFSRWSLG